MSDEQKTPEEIRHEIAETREQIGRDIDAISHRLSPEHMKYQAHEVLEDAQDVALRASRTLTERMNNRIRHVNNDVVDILARNPMPVTLLGAGLGWLLLRSSSSRPSETPAGRSGMALQGPATGSAVTTDPTDRVQTQPETGLPDPAINGGVQIRPTYTEYPADRNTGWVQEHPLLVGVAALAAGALIGALLPSTTQEDRTMGPAKSRLMGEAQATAKRLKQDASVTADEVRQEVQSSSRE